MELVCTDNMGCSRAGVWGTSHRPVPSFGSFGGWSQALLLLSEIKGSALAWRWCSWTEPQLWLCSVSCGLLGVGEPGQPALLLPARATSSSLPV